MESKVFYDREGNKKIYSYGKKIAHGSFGRVYRIDEDTCIKIFKSFSRLTSEKAIRMIKNMKLSNFYQINELFYDEEKRFNGYTMKYYADEKLDILAMPTEYLIQSFLGIYESMKKLTNVSITINDLRSYNALKTKDGIIVIDVDHFYPNDSISKNDIFANNKNRVYGLFKDMFYLAAIIYHKHYVKGIDDTATDIFEYNQSPDEICKKLIKYKYPIDYLKSCR